LSAIALFAVTVGLFAFILRAASARGAPGQ
jgi:hypothetical protein